MTIKGHSIAQILATILQALNMFGGFVPVKYQPVIAFALTVVQGAMGLYNHYFSPTGVKIVAALLLMFLFGGAAHAQTPAPAPTPLFSVSTQAVALRIGGQTVAGTDAIGSLNLTPNLQLRSENILAPANNFQSYMGGAAWYAPFLSKPFAKTTLSNVKPYISAAFGIARNVPATGTAQQHYSALAGLGFDWAVNGTLSVGPRISYLNAAGFGPSPHGALVSANLTLILGSH